MKKVFLFLILLNLNINIFAKSENTGEISGKILDATTSDLLQSASVVLIKSNDSTIISGSKSDKKGNFNISKIPYGNYSLKISYLGYENKILNDIALNKETPSIDLGSLKIKPTATNLDAVQVTAERNVIEYSGGKKIINIDKSMVSTGGNALDVMRTIPSVDVDMDGNIGIRGTQSVKILIDGRPSAMMGNTANVLENLPAGMIESVELITNPSAKYEAEGLSGIINIVLKKQINTGLNGQATLNIGTKDKYSGSLNLNYNTGFANVFAAYDLRSDIRLRDNNSKRINTFIDSDSISMYLNSSNRRRKSMNHNIKAGIDLNFDQANKMSISGSYRNFDGSSFELGNQSEYNYFNSLQMYEKTFNNELDPSSNMDLNLNYMRLLGSKDHKITLDASLSNSDDNEEIDINNLFFLADKVTPIDSIYNQFSKNLSKYKNYNIQLDYENKFSDDSKMEAGIKSNFRSTDDNYEFKFQDSQDKTFKGYLNHFIYDEFINAAYLTYSFKLSDVGFVIGLRTENTNTHGDQKSTNQTFEKNYLDFFPSLNFNYKLNSLLEFQFNYSRRIERPDMGELNPFPDYMDPLNARYGNPDLEPEYINSYELGLIKNMEKITLNATIFYRQTDNAITRFARLDTNNLMIMTFLNLASQKTYGVEFGLVGDILEWWKINADFSYYKAILESPKNMNMEKREDSQWNTKFTNTFNLLENLNLQVSCNYSAPNVTLQGERKAFYSMDISSRWDATKNLAFTFRWSDVLKSHGFKVHAVGEGFDITREFKPDFSSVTLGITYKINDGLKQRERKRTSENTGGGDFEM